MGGGVCNCTFAKSAPGIGLGCDGCVNVACGGIGWLLCPGIKLSIPCPYPYSVSKILIIEKNTFKSI
jgi:hypothetical protein